MKTIQISRIEAMEYRCFLKNTVKKLEDIIAEEEKEFNEEISTELEKDLINSKKRLLKQKQELIERLSDEIRNAW